MAKRSTPLYEMMVKRGEPTEAPRAPRAPKETDAPHDGGPSLSGRMLRVPVGYALVALAAVVALVIGSYIFGAARGAHAKQAEFESLIADGAASTGRVLDPLLVTPSIEMGGTGPVGERRSTTGTAGGSDRRSGGGGVGNRAAGEGPVESDPRESGLNYLVLAETQPTGAVRLAEFCREHGLAAYVIPGNNARLRRVIALPGFATRSTSDPAVQRLLQDVRRIGLSWKSSYPGESDLSDAYLSP